MSVLRLRCWNEDLARERARVLKDSGFRVDASPLNPSGLIGHFRAAMPAAVVIDLDRLPSHGREVAAALRNSRATRHIPIVFAGGIPEKVERIRHELPDAVFTEWKGVARALKKSVEERASRTRSTDASHAALRCFQPGEEAGIKGCYESCFACGAGKF